MSEPLLERIGARVQERYEGDRRLMSLDDFLELFFRDPYPLVRNAVQYLRDAIEFYGSYEIDGIGGKVRRWRIFDAEFSDADDPVVGLEHAQQTIVDAIGSAAAEGRLTRMLVLHGPNGSGKSSLVELLQAGLEDYSHRPEGAMYALRWIFPKQQAEGAGLGFRKNRDDDSLESYALLEPEDVAARVVCELRDSPLFLIPDSERTAVLEQALESSPERRKESFALFRHGNLSPKSKKIYEGLLAAYKGDWRKVMRHVQVERIYVSRRFRMGAVVTQPQGTPDAQLRPISGDALTAGLPGFLQATALFEVVGDLADANRGILEFSDFLKRNLEYSKYLLQTLEKGFVSIGTQLIELDMVFMATVNERHLEAFKKLPEFASFQARMLFTRVPYLRQASAETAVYERICDEIRRSRPVARHVARAAALFGLLTRVRRPQKDAYEGNLKEIAHALTPLQKVRLYDTGAAPSSLARADARELRAAIPRIRDEFAFSAHYEGRFGASVRDLRTVLLKAAVREDSDCLGPTALVAELGEMIRDPSLYLFLQVEADGAYHDAKQLVATTTRELATWIVDDVQEAMDVVREDEYDRRFDLYFQHVVASTTGERARDPRTGGSLPLDEGLLDSVEALLPIGDDKAAYRRGLVSRIGAYAVDHPDERPLDYRQLFPDLFRAMKRRYFDERREMVTRVERHILLHGTEDFALLPQNDRELAERTRANLLGKDGYDEVTARDLLSFALTHFPEPEDEPEDD